MKSLTTKTLGQYFTTSPFLQHAVFQLILNQPSLILEPSVGRGDLVKYVRSQNPSVTFDCYEIDTTIRPLIRKEDIIFTNFLTHTIPKTYTTIIGNPPYVKLKTKNLYIDFIDKCATLLQPDGELIFIVPSDTFKLTSSIPYIKRLFSTGHLTHIIHPHDEHLFKDASIDVIVFRFANGSQMEQTGTLLYNGQKRYYYYNDLLYTFTHPLKNNLTSVETLFSLHVGLVSGCEKVFKHELGNTSIVTDIDDDGRPLSYNYIFTTSFPTEDDRINEHLLTHKKQLLRRKIRKFNQNNWFEWGAVRNIGVMTRLEGKPCIFIRNITRKPQVATIGQVARFSGNIMCLIPKSPTIPLESVVAFLNSPSFKENFIYAGRFRISHKQLAKCCITH